MKCYICNKELLYDIPFTDAEEHFYCRESYALSDHGYELKLED